MQSQCGQPDFWEALWESVRFSETIPAQIPPPPPPPHSVQHTGGWGGRQTGEPTWTKSFFDYFYCEV